MPRGEEAGDDFAQMLVAAQENDPRAREVLANAAKALAVAARQCNQPVESGRIILGGRFVAAGDSCSIYCVKNCRSTRLPELVANVDVRLAELGEDSAFLGIAARAEQSIRLSLDGWNGGATPERQGDR